MDYHLDLLLDLPHVTVEFCTEIEGIYILTLRLLNETSICPHCKCEMERVNQTNYILIRDLYISGKSVILKVPRRQFQCGHCGRFSTEELPFISWKHQYTKRYEEWIYEQGKRMSLEQISRDEELCAQTIKKIFTEQAEANINSKEWINSKYLSLDEFANRKGHKDFKTTVVDLEHHKLIEVINSHRSEDIYNVLAKIPEDIRAEVEEVSIDMWGGFAGVIGKIFTNAKIVYDHFHIIQNVNKELNKLRKILNVKGKGLYYLLIKNKEDLTEEEKSDLTTFLSESPVLGIAYELKEELRDIYRSARTPGSAKRQLQKWLRYAKLFFRDSAGSIERHLEGVCNYFAHHMSSGITEGINTKIKLIKRRSYGLPKFEYLRLMLLTCFET